MRVDDAKAIFLKDTASHELSILHDDGIYRHLVGKRPGTSVSRFDIVTFPGYLVYTGDMGAFTFTRLNDMFEFFRAAARYEHAVNPSYWAEKLEAVCKTDGYQEFDENLFEQQVRERVKEWAEEQDEPLSEDLTDSVEQLIFDGRSGEAYAYKALRDFESGEKHRNFDDAWEWDFNRFTHRYLWCCHAIVWAIARYDEQQKARA